MHQAPSHKQRQKPSGKASNQPQTDYVPFDHQYDQTLGIIWLSTLPGETKNEKIIDLGNSNRGKIQLHPVCVSLEQLDFR